LWLRFKRLRIKKNDRAILRQKTGILSMFVQILWFLGHLAAGGRV
jgi:hypothetical protein